ncbi:nuclear transport factor 2 family protein [Kocuria sp. M1R5S2]|uniref:nuclear transport factor 2 family protein n=1 Tax=Kocuria rhizosphaerae TaxID=3376285 RepID=UPI0037992A1A
MTLTRPSADLDTKAQIRELEDQRYDAMLRGAADDFAKLCHKDLTYTHSDGSRDTLASYMDKLTQRFYVYEHIDHPIEDIVLVDDTAVVVGSMNADILAAGAPKRLENLCISVWVRQGDQWRLLAFEPTPVPKTNK